MQTLYDRIRGLSAKITSLADSQVTEVEAQGFATRAAELSIPSDAISVPSRRLALFAAKGIRVEGPFPEARTLKRTIDELAVKYDADPRSILAPDANWRLTTRSQLVRIADRVNAQLSSGWQSYVLSRKPIVDQGLLHVLRRSPAHVVHANRVEELSVEFNKLAERLPTSLEDIDRPERISVELRRVMEDLPNEYPQPVRQLFQAINQGNATAAHLTDEAVEWLRENNLLETLRISWRYN